jgi:hypothetical protein
MLKYGGTGRVVINGFDDAQYYGTVVEGQRGGSGLN